VRSVPIDRELVPLLKGMHKRAEESGGGDDSPILPVLADLNDRYRAKQFRDHLRIAGVTRPRLFTETATLLQVDFRSCRDTGITWLALAGIGVDKMQRRAGHEDLSTTLGYVKMAEDLAGKVGVPFPPLPSDLLGQGLGQVARQPPKNPRDRVPEEGIAHDCTERERSTVVTDDRRLARPSGLAECRRRESNPRPSAYETPALNRLSYSGLGP
jgi:hypothetical protein